MSPKPNARPFTPNLTIENARIVFRNFSGLEGMFNPAGKRNFCVLINHDVEALAERGWNIKYLKPRDEEEPPQAYLKVQVAYKNTPPKITIISNRKQTHLDEDSVSLLDWAEIEYVDLIVSPYYWDKAGKTGITAYAKTMYVTIKVDELELKYKDVPDSALSALPDD